MPSYTKLLLTSTVVATSLFLAGCSAQSPETSTEVTPAEQMTVEATSAPVEGTLEMTRIESTEEMTTEGKELTTVEKYQTPAGEEQVEFTLVVDDKGVIIDAQTEVMAKAPISITRQEAFKKDFAAAVQGKKLDELMKVDRIAGSSLTTGAFNKGLENLKKQMES